MPVTASSWVVVISACRCGPASPRSTAAASAGAAGQPVADRIDEVELLLDAERGARRRAAAASRSGSARREAATSSGWSTTTRAPVHGKGAVGRHRRCPGTRGRLVISRGLTVRPALGAHQLPAAPPGQGSAYQAKPRPGSRTRSARSSGGPSVVSTGT